MTEQPSRERAESCQHVWGWGEGRGGSGMEPSSGRDWLVVLPCCPPFPGWLRVKAPANWADDCGLQDVTNLLTVGAPALVLTWTMYLVSTSITHKNNIAERQASLVVEQWGAFLRRCVRKPRRPWGGRKACVPSSPLCKCWASPEDVCFFSRRKSLRFWQQNRSREIELDLLP